MRWTPMLAAAMLAFLLAAGVTACGGDDSPGQSAEPQPSEQQPTGETESVHHIHGLGVDPSNGTLYVATHTGLFQASKGEQQLRRIGDSAQDIMGFSVVAPDRFIGSGHPDPNDTSSPPNLGLIESPDRGKTWKNISLLGEADFHVLHSSGQRIYGYDGTQGRLMVSDDGGRQWAQRTPPAAMFDLAIDPRDADRIVASTERGVFSSTNAGKAWRPLRDDTAGLLAWPAARPAVPGRWAGTGAAQRRRWPPVAADGQHRRPARRLHGPRLRPLRRARRQHRQTLDRRRRELDPQGDAVRGESAGSAAVAAAAR